MLIVVFALDGAASPTAVTTIQPRSTARGWLTSRLIFPIAGMSSISDAAAAFRLPGASQPPVIG